MTKMKQNKNSDTIAEDEETVSLSENYVMRESGNS